ncbi:recombinase family protein [Pseudomonas aeruginosa]|uniref:Resolvase n=27 Tax=Gammaproteobacteria TaxID=1236 RepID=G2I9K5_ECOLX|nr:recombinase family protein [Pseudomonas aeruginosa]AGX85698.1 resolvase domain-containing protein [Providencia rettgeri]AHZ58499.1 resolvase [Acinetobacter haemolyticus]AKI07090.1 Resolvase [Acinetobacter bereziniae]AKI07099.1 resolvase [Acinetobacter baumannii]BAK69659.1 resolvase [Escherichia coli]
MRLSNFVILVMEKENLDIEDQIKNTPFQRVGYIRVSTKDQNPERQLHDLPFELDKTFIDHFSGKTAKRPALQEMFDYVRSGDIVYAHDVFRLARSLIDLVTIVQKLNKKGVSVHIVKNNLNFTPNSDDKFDKFQLHVLGAVAELERGIISENQAEGIKLAKKKKGKYKGRSPAITEEKLKELIHTLKNKDDSYPFTQIAKDYGVSYMTLIRYRKKYAKQINAQSD